MIDAPAPATAPPEVTRVSQVLLVLSDPDHRAAVAAFLTAAGAVVLEAEGGLHALTQVERAAPEAVLAGGDLGDLGADELLEILRSEPATEGVPFLLVAPEAPAWLSGPQDHLLSDQLTSRGLALAALDSLRVWLDDGQPVTRPAGGGTVHMSGTLELVSLFDLVVSFNAMQKSGCVTVAVDGHEVIVLIGGGEVTHAEFMGERGEAALRRAFEATGQHPSTFTFEGLPPEMVAGLPRTIRLPTSRLLLELAVHLDHLRADRPHS